MQFKMYGEDVVSWVVVGAKQEAALLTELSNNESYKLD